MLHHTDPLYFSELQTRAGGEKPLCGSSRLGHHSCCHAATHRKDRHTPDAVWRQYTLQETPASARDQTLQVGWGDGIEAGDWLTARAMNWQVKHLSLTVFHQDVPRHQLHYDQEAPLPWSSTMQCAQRFCPMSEQPRQAREEAQIGKI